MTQEVRNLKGEIVHESDDDQHRFLYLPMSTWLLIGGLIIFNFGCFFYTGIVDYVFRLFDVRLWPWWYFAVLGIILLFSIKWFFMIRNWEDYDEVSIDTAKRFNRMAITVSATLLFLVFLNAINATRFFLHPLADWWNVGTFSWIAFFTVTVCLLTIVFVLYLAWEWVTSYFIG